MQRNQPGLECHPEYTNLSPLTCKPAKLASMDGTSDAMAITFACHTHHDHHDPLITYWRLTRM